MIDFSQLKIVKKSRDNFVGIRQSDSDDKFEFCLPNGFEEFPEDDYDTIRNLFFNLYRTFHKFERDNINSSRFQHNEREYQNQQDEINISSGGISLQNEDGEACVIYSKIQSIERVLEAYDDLTIQSIQYKNRRTEEIDYSQIHKYLEKAIYLEDDVIYVEAMDLPRPIVNYDSTDLIQLYCYILYEIIQQLNEDVADNIKARIPDIKFLAESFQDKYLTLNQSLFDRDTYLDTINTLKDTLEIIDNNTFYKDNDYWQLYEAIEIFLYGKIDPDRDDGEYWGIKGFSYVWEDMCNTYFFKTEYERIYYADTDIVLGNHKNQNPERSESDSNRVGNYSFRDKTLWVYCKKPDIQYPEEEDKFSWVERLSIEYNLESGTCVPSNTRYNHLENRNKNRKKALRRFLKPDLVINNVRNNSSFLSIIDYKNVSLDFFQRNKDKDFKETDEKYRIDVIKQLTYELALQKIKKIKSYFLIPYYDPENTDNFYWVNIKKIKGIEIRQCNFNLILKYYLDNN